MIKVVELQHFTIIKIALQKYKKKQYAILEMKKNSTAVKKRLMAAKGEV